MFDKDILVKDVHYTKRNLSGLKREWEDYWEGFVNRLSGFVGYDAAFNSQLHEAFKEAEETGKPHRLELSIRFVVDETGEHNE